MSYSVPRPSGDLLLADRHDRVFLDLKEQLCCSDEIAAVPFTVAGPLGSEGLRALKVELEESLHTSMAVDVDLIANSITILPLFSMPSERDCSSSSELHHLKKSGKVPRPPSMVTIEKNLLMSFADVSATDAFILYRKEWHPRVVAANPGLHNNRISVLLGQRWRSESQTVRDEYKRRAALAKEEHAILHPEYSYQPRRPSEKKRRMTKSKLARLAATGASRATTIRFDQVPDHAVFDAHVDFGDTLAAAFDKARPAGCTVLPEYAASRLINTSDGLAVTDVIQFAVTSPEPGPPLINAVWNDMTEVLASRQANLFYSNDSTVSGPGFRGSNVNATICTSECKEVQRQISLQEEMNALFDFDSAATIVDASANDEQTAAEGDQESENFLLDPAFGQDMAE